MVGSSLLLSSSSARAAATLVQSNSATSTSTSVTATWGSAVVAGHLLVATVSANGTNVGGAPVFTPPSGWTAIATGANSGKVSAAIYYIANCSARTSGTSEIFGVTNSSATTVRLLEFSGILTAGPLDVSGTATGGGASTSSVSSTGTVSSSPELGVAVFAHQIPGTATNEVAASSPYSDVGANLLVGAGSTGVHEDTIYNTGVTGGAAATASVAVSANQHSWAFVVATFQQAPLYWRGGLTGCASGSSFSSTSCWSTTSGGASAGVAPGTSDRTTFDGNGVGNCALNSTTAGSITTVAGYTGTITQGAQNLATVNDITIGGGTFNGHSGQTISTNQSGTYNGGIVVNGGTFNGNGATLAVNGLYVSSGTFTAGTGNFSTNNVGTAILSGGTTTFSSGTATFAGLVTMSGGTVTFGSGAATFSGGIDVEGATVTLGSSATTTTVTGTATVGSGTLNFTNGSAATDFSNTLAFTQSGGTINMNGATVALGSTITSGSNDAFIQSAGTFNNTTSGGALNVGSSGGGGGNFDQTGSTAVYSSVAGATETFNGRVFVSGSTTVGTATMAGTGVATRKDVFINSGGTMAVSSAGFAFSGPSAMTVAGTLNCGTGTVSFSPTVTVSGTIDGSSGTQTYGNTLTVSSGGLVKTGTTSMTNGTNANQLVTISSGGTMTVGTPGFSFASTTSMPIDGTLNLAGPVTFAGPVALTGALVAGSGTTTISGAVTMTGTSSFSGGTGTTTFSVAPTLTSGTFTVGTAGSTGSVVMTAGATFASGMTLAFPTSGGTLSTPGGQTLSIAGTLTSSAGAATTQPKIARSTGATGITVAFTSSAIFNADGLEFDNVASTGVSIANGATFTKLAHLTFKNNIGGTTSTHLLINLTSGTVAVSGCYFDTTATNNVTLNGASGNLNKAHAIFELQSTALNGSGAGESRDADGDTNDDNVGDTTTTPYWGSVIEWTYAAPADTAGAAVGPPVAAFDWNTFTYYAIYSTFSNIGGANTTDRLWKRNSDGSAAYSYDVADSNGDIVGTPRYDTLNEVSLNQDVDGDGLKTSTSVHVVYIATSLGHIIKLIDNGSSFALPGSSSVWHTDFTSSSVTAIKSPLLSDGLNLYFGGLDASSASTIFGVQIASGASEKTLQKTITPTGTGAISTAPAWASYSGSSYLFVGSAAVTSKAYVYRAQVSPGATIETGFSPASLTSNVTGLNLINNRLFVSTQGGSLYELDASNFATSGSFTTFTGFPYTGASAIAGAPFADARTNYAYFGDSAGKLYIVTSTGANLTGYPSTLLSSTQITTTPYYKTVSGTIAVGAADGYAYFINRHDATNTPQIRKRFVVGNGAVTAISYDSNAARYMAASADGRLTYISASDVGTDTDGVE
ncbi:MAG TPA: hypothetical protein VHJ20_18280 [Polyangia bacterium]|nr:hypothetical protein [Polyangia bacterium]